MVTFRYKYKRESYRLKNWDYRNSGICFIIIGTKDRAYHFGNCRDEQMQWNKPGEIATKFWKGTQYISDM